VSTDPGAATVYLAGLNGTGWLTGSLDDMRVYNRALSDGEVKQLYNMGR